MRVEIYWNLHKKMYSVRNLKTGRVIAHTYEAIILQPEFVVRQAGNRKVRETGVKNVHAFVRGKLYGLDADVIMSNIPDHMMWDMYYVTYNPYKYTSFVDVDDKKPIRKAGIAALQTGIINTPVITAFSKED